MMAYSTERAMRLARLNRSGWLKSELVPLHFAEVIPQAILMPAKFLGVFAGIAAICWLEIAVLKYSEALFFLLVRVVAVLVVSGGAYQFYRIGKRSDEGVEI